MFRISYIFFRKKNTVEDNRKLAMRPGAAQNNPVPYAILLPDWDLQSGMQESGIIALVY